MDQGVIPAATMVGSEQAFAPELSSATVLYAGQPLEVACAALASLGLHYVDLWHVPGWCEHLAEGPQRIAAVLRAHGLTLQAISAFRASPAELARLLPILAQLGAPDTLRPCLVTESARAGPSVEQFAALIRPLVEQADALGVTLAIENHGDLCIDSTASMQELVERLPGPALGIALAPIHLHSRAESTADAIRVLGGRIALCYLWDWGPTAAADWRDPAEQFLGTGEIDYGPIAAALRSIGYVHPLDVFAHGTERWLPERTTAALGAALARAQALFADRG